jgi:hypothetical protein
MPTDGALSVLAVLLDELRSRLGLEHESGPDQEALRGVFGVNNEIGRLIRTRPSLRPALTDLQAHLNLVTIELKRGNKRRASEAFRDVEKRFGEIMRGPDAP